MNFKKTEKDHISLKEHFNIKIKALKTAIGIKLLAVETLIDLKVTAVEKAADLKNKTIETSVILAAQSLEKRLDHMNEFREALKEQAGSFVTRTEFNMQNAALEDDIRILRESKVQLEGKASQSSVNTAYVISIIGIILAVAALVRSLI